VLEAARLWLETDAGAGRAEGLLRAALQGARDPAPEWQSTARVLLAWACAVQGRCREAAEQLTQLSAGPHGDLLALLERLQRLTDVAPADMRAECGALELRAVELLEPQRGRLDASTLRVLARLAARALADAGRTAQALAAYEALARAYPRDGAIQEAYARALSACSETASLTAARRRWLEIVAHSEPGSPRWFRAEYEVAELDYRLGDVAHARQIVDRLEVLYPTLGGPELKARFARLAERLRQGRCTDYFPIPCAEATAAGTNRIRGIQAAKAGLSTMDCDPKLWHPMATPRNTPTTPRHMPIAMNTLRLSRVRTSGRPKNSSVTSRNGCMIRL